MCFFVSSTFCQTGTKGKIDLTSYTAEGIGSVCSFEVQSFTAVWQGSLYVICGIKNSLNIICFGWKAEAIYWKGTYCFHSVSQFMFLRPKKCLYSDMRFNGSPASISLYKVLEMAAQALWQNILWSFKAIRFAIGNIKIRVNFGPRPSAWVLCLKLSLTFSEKKDPRVFSITVRVSTILYNLF